MASTSKEPFSVEVNMILTPVKTSEDDGSTTPEDDDIMQITPIAYFPKGQRMFSGSQDKTTRQWDLQAGKEIEEARDVCEEEVWAAAVSRDGRWVVTGGGDDERHSQRITCIDISADNVLLASGSFDRTARIWNLETGKLVAGPFKSDDDAGAVRFSPDSKKHPSASHSSILIPLVRTWTVPLSDSEKELQQASKFSHHVRCLVLTIHTEKPRPRRAPIPTSRFFDGFDPHPPPGRNNRAATTTRHDEGSGIQNMMNHIFSRSSASQGHTPRPRKTPLVDVFATRGKYRTANAHTGKRHKLAQPPRPRKQAHTSHAGASNSSAPLAGTFNVVGGTAAATLQTGITRSSSPLDVGHAPHTSCFTVLARCFPRLS
ncbi:WD40 repeat-like protein [Suillus weaverae]|nr:WD40 repeat-like protein [Suillus weaverae]